MAEANSTSSSTDRPHSSSPRGGFGTQPLRDYGSLALTLLVGAAASASGVGGGAFYVPLFDIALGLGVKGATATSQVAVAAGSLAAVAARWGRRHPADPGRPVVDWQMASVLQPPLLLGVSAGLLANHALPSWAITFVLILFLVFITFDTCVRATRLHRRETAAREEALAGAEEEAARAAAEAAEVAAGGGGGAGAGAVATATPRVTRPSSSYAAGSMASLGTGSFLEDLFSVGAARMSQQQQRSPSPARARRTRSMFAAVSSSPASASAAAAAAAAAAANVPSTAAAAAAAAAARRGTADGAAAAAVPPHAAAGRRRRAVSMFNFGSSSSMPNDNGAAGVAAADGGGSYLENGNGSNNGNQKGKASSLELASSIPAQLYGQDINEEEEGDDDDDDRDDVSSLGVGGGGSSLGGGVGSSLGGVA